MAKINRLTPKQEALLPVWRDRWIKIGLCTEPADRARAEAALTAAYRHAKLKPPRFVWCGSPLSMALTRAVVDKILADKKIGASVGDSVRDSVGASVWDSVRDSVRASVWDSVGDSVWASVWDSVRASVGDSVRDSVWDSVRDSVGDSVRASVRDSVRASVWASVVASVGDSVGDSGYGQHDANWLAFYDFFRHLGLRKETAALEPLTELAQAANWFLPHRGICWVSERHSVVMQDERARLHCLTGPAVKYPDGFAIYAVHGVKVPRWIIDQPETINVKSIDGEANAEIRRVMVDRYGLARYIRDSGAKVIDHEEGIGTLYRKDEADDSPIMMVEVVNSTPEPDGSFKRYMLDVSGAGERLIDDRPSRKGKQTARAAVAATFGLRASQYMPAVET